MKHALWGAALSHVKSAPSDNTLLCVVRRTIRTRRCPLLIMARNLSWLLVYCAIDIVEKLTDRIGTDWAMRTQ